MIEKVTFPPIIKLMWKKVVLPYKRVIFKKVTLSSCNIGSIVCCVVLHGRYDRKS